MMMVYPSGGAFATNSDPIAWDAPGLFSTTTGLPKRSLSLAPTILAATSVTPPGASGTMMRMGLFG